MAGRVWAEGEFRGPRATNEQGSLDENAGGWQDNDPAMGGEERLLLGRRQVLMGLGGALGMGLVGLPGVVLGKGKGPYADEMADIRANLKAFPTVKKVAIVGVVEVLEDARTGKQDYLYQKIPSQKLTLRFNYFIPEGFTVLTRSASDVDAMLKGAGLGMAELLNSSQIPVLGQAFGADALLVGAFYSATRNGYEVEVQSSVFVKLIDVKTGALIWAKELEKKELQVPGTYNRPGGGAPPPGVRP